MFLYFVPNAHRIPPMAVETAQQKFIIILFYTEHCSVWSYQFYWYYYYGYGYCYYGTDEDFWMKISRRFLEDSRLFIYFLLLISDEDFYGGRTGPLEKFYLFIYFL